MPTITGTSGPDVLSAPAGSTESWTLSGLEGDDTLNGGDGNDVLDGGPGADIMRGYWGHDIYYVDNVGDVVEDGAGNEIRTTLASYSMPIYIHKLTGLLATGQVLTGNYSDNIILGGGGDDRLWGGAGIDQLIGGAGNDTYILKDYDSDRSDTIVETANNGTDEVLVGLAGYTLAANVENATATGANITLTGKNLANVLRGSSYNDSLDGGAGADTMIGGAGSDWYYVDNAGDVIVEALAGSGGTGDTVVTAFSYYQIQAGVELLQGTSARQTLVGHDGDNWLMSKGGGDTLIGGLGNDLYEIQAGDVIVEHANQGIDLVRTTFASYTLPEHLEELQGTSFVTSQILIGNAADNRIIGTLFNNQSDTIDGGGGVDRMYGWHGSDIYYVDNVLDYIEEEAHHGTADQVRTTADYTLPTNIEILIAWAGTGLALTGNALANTITGGAGADVLTGGLGADILDGGVGADTFRYAAATESTASATDRIRAFQSGVDLIDLNALGARTISWTELTDPADSTLYSLVTVMAGSATMKIRVDGQITIQDFTEEGQVHAGTAGDDTLTGGSGNDSLNGGGGADVMDGRGGDDTYFVDSAGDQIFEAAGQGNDRVYASVDYVLYAGQSVETLSTDFHAGTAAINLGGNELDNIIYGNAGNNILYGKGGNDFIGGLGGDDSYYIDSAGDYVQEASDGGFDRIYAGGDYTLYTGQSIEILSTDWNAGTAAINLGGNELNNIIYGNAGANILYGKGGNDWLEGLSGGDSYYVDSAGDYVREVAAGGADRIFAGGDYTLYTGQEVEILSTDHNAGTASIALGGNELDNIIYGNDGANILYGKEGNDTLMGLGGNDQFWFNTALGASNVDTIYGFASGADKLVLFQSVFAGLGSGTLPASVFVTGTAAADTDDRIVYNSATGALLYDADGSGGGAAVQFATLNGAPALAASDFMVF